MFNVDFNVPVDFLHIFVIFTFCALVYMEILKTKVFVLIRKEEK